MRTRNLLIGLTDMLTSINASTEVIAKTPVRVLEAYEELFSGYSVNPQEILKSSFCISRSEMVIIKDIPFSSTCEHHLMPFIGKACFGYLPRSNVVGLSKIPRLIDCFSKRLQMQERLCNEIVDAFQSIVFPLGCGIIMEATHTCMSLRGARSNGSLTRTHSLAGSFLENDSVKQEFFGAIK